MCGLLFGPGLVFLFLFFVLLLFCFCFSWYGGCFGCCFRVVLLVCVWFVVWACFVIADGVCSVVGLFGVFFFVM